MSFSIILPFFLGNVNPFGSFPSCAPRIRIPATLTESCSLQFTPQKSISEAFSCRESASRQLSPKAAACNSHLRSPYPKRSPAGNPHPDIPTPQNRIRRAGSSQFHNPYFCAVSEGSFDRSSSQSSSSVHWPLYSPAAVLCVPFRRIRTDTFTPSARFFLS